MERKVYYFNTTWWFITIFFGLTCELAVIYMILEIPFYQFTNLQNWFWNIAGILLSTGMMLLGLLCQIITFTSKIIVSSEGMEYHSLASIVKLRWSDVKVHIHQNSSIQTVSLRVSNPEIKLRFWTRYVPWDTYKGSRENLVHRGIPIWQFGGFAPRRLVDDILRFSSN
jgi:hypothetical protein